MKRIKVITASVIAATLALAAASDALPRDRRRVPGEAAAVQRTGRVAANLPDDGSFEACFFREELLGLRWPGESGTEFLGYGGMILRFRREGDERLIVAGPGDFRGAYIASPEMLFFEGCEGGKRFPDARRDDDGDGMIDEDPLDGADNDGDGYADEDFAAVGNGMTATRAVLPGQGISVRQNSYAWSFGHVRDFIGFSTVLEYQPEGERELPALVDVDIALFMDFRIGRARDDDRGRDDLFYLIRERSGDEEGCRAEGFAAASDSRAGSPIVGFMVLDVAVEGGKSVLPGVDAVILEAQDAPDSLWSRLDFAVEDGETPSRLSVISGSGDGEEEEDSRGYGNLDERFMISNAKRGRLALAGRVERIGRLEPGKCVRITWALVFGRNREALVRNALMARQTWMGAKLDGETVSNWIVPARKAARIRLDAVLAPLWIHGRRKPAAAIKLPSSMDEEVEWLKVSGEMTDTYEVSAGRVMVPVDEKILETGEQFTIEGQMTDGTIFKAVVEEKEIDKFGVDDSISPDRLPDDCLKLFPNPFVADLNVDLHIHEPATFQTLDTSSKTQGASSVRIYDVTGRLVRTILEEEFLHPGDYTMGWDGKDSNGIAVSPGVYYCKLQVGERSLTKRVILLR